MPNNRQTISTPKFRSWLRELQNEHGLGLLALLCVRGLPDGSTELELISPKKEALPDDPIDGILLNMLVNSVHELAGPERRRTLGYIMDMLFSEFRDDLDLERRERSEATDKLESEVRSMLSQILKHRADTIISQTERDIQN